MARTKTEASRNDWNTPPHIVRAVKDAFGGTIDLDPCSNPTSQVGATINLSRETGHDGRAVPWTGNVFVNPPYGGGLLVPWVHKAAREASRGAKVILLIPAAVGNKWWHEPGGPWSAGTRICFISGRLSFLENDVPKKGNPSDSALVYYGSEDGADQFERKVSHLGCVVAVQRVRPAQLEVA